MTQGTSPAAPAPDIDAEAAIAHAAAWLEALDGAHPHITRAPARDGYMRGFDAYVPNRRVNVVAAALELFRRGNGRYPDPVNLPESRDHFFLMKFFEFMPLPSPADKLGLAHYLPARMADSVFTPARPWVSTRAELPPDDAVPPGRYFVKLSLGCERNIRVAWPPPAQGRSRIEDALRAWFKERFGIRWGEWWYGLGPQRVFLEEDISARMAGRPEVKIYVREGRPVLGYQIAHDFATGVHAQRYFRSDLRPSRALTRGYRRLDAALPESIGQMMAVAAALGRAFRLVRVDFLDVGGPRPCVGELTLCDQNAGRRYAPPGFDREVKRLLFDPPAAPAA